MTQSRIKVNGSSRINEQTNRRDDRDPQKGANSDGRERRKKAKINCFESIFLISHSLKIILLKNPTVRNP